MEQVWVEMTFCAGGDLVEHSDRGTYSTRMEEASGWCILLRGHQYHYRNIIYIFDDDSFVGVVMAAFRTASVRSGPPGTFSSNLPMRCKFSIIFSSPICVLCFRHQLRPKCGQGNIPQTRELHCMPP